MLIDKHSCQGKVQEAWRHLFLIGRSSKVQGCAEDYERLKRDKICHIYSFTSKHSFMTVLQMFSATNEGGGEGEREYWFQVMWWWGGVNGGLVKNAKLHPITGRKK